MKKTYQNPELTVVSIAMTGIICGSVTDVDGGDSGIGYGGGGSGPARVRHRSVWDDEWEEWDEGD